MRVELVLPSLVRAGMEVITAELALRLHERGHEVGVTCTHDLGALAAPLSDAGIRVSLVDSAPMGFGLRRTPLEDHFRSLQPDVVHSQSGSWLKSALAARRAGVAGMVHTVHGLKDEERLKDQMVMFAAGVFTDQVITVSESLERYLAEEVHLRGRKVSTLMNGVDCERFNPEGDPGPLRAELELSDDDVLFGIVARFAPVKDHRTLVSAFERVCEARSNVHLALIGDGELRDSVEAQVRDLGLESRVHFCGLVGDTPPAYRSLDAFVLSSKNEGTSISILEALASGLPIVATEVGGTPDLFEHGVQGYLVPPQDPDALASELLRVANEPETRVRMADAARSRAEGALSLEHMVRGYEQVYERAVGDG